MELKIVEHVSGVWSYHWALKDEYTALCGKRSMMNTSIPPRQWGKTPPNYHIPEKWCGGCAAIRLREYEEKG